MQSLADFLGVAPGGPAAPDHAERDAYAELSGKDFALAVLNSPDFRRYIVLGLNAGDLAPAVLCRLIDHGWGKPVERVEVQSTHTLDGLSPAELRDHLRDRVASLQTMLQLLDDDEAPGVH